MFLLVACVAAAALLNPLPWVSGVASSRAATASPPDSLHLVAVIDGDFAKLTVPKFLGF